MGAQGQSTATLVALLVTQRRGLVAPLLAARNPPQATTGGLLIPQPENVDSTSSHTYHCGSISTGPSEHACDMDSPLGAGSLECDVQ